MVITETTKGTSLCETISYEPLYVEISSVVFAVQQQ